MKDDKIIKTHYLSISQKYLVNKIVIHFFLFLIEIILIFLQMIEIDYNNHKIPGKKFLETPISNLLEKINNIPNIIKTLVYDIIIIFILVNYFIFNYYRLENNTYVKIMINLLEMLFYRILSLLIFNYLFIFSDFYYFINIIITIPYIVILLFYFYNNHLNAFFPTSLLSYPYDNFSMIIDLHLLFIKLSLSISITNTNEKIDILFFYISVLIIFTLTLYLSYIVIYKSYFLMNNIILNKLRYSTVVALFILIFLVLVNDKNIIFNTYMIICYCNIFAILITFIYYIYDPFQFSKFDKDDNIENILYYFFILDKEKNKNFLIEEKIDEHLSRCNKCNLCKKYNNISYKKDEDIDLYKIIYNNKSNIFNLQNKIVRGIKKNGRNSLLNNSYYLINIIYIYCMNFNQYNFNALLNTELLFEIINSENQFLEDYKMSLECIKYTNKFFIKAKNIIKSIDSILDEKNFEKNIKNFNDLGENLIKLNYKDNKINNSNYNIEGLPDCSNLLTICSIFYEELYNEPVSSSGISIRNSQNILEELNTNNYKTHKQITLEINLKRFVAKILRSGGEINKFENNNFFDLFPSIFKNSQIKAMKNILLHSNENPKIPQNNKKKLTKNKGKEKGKQYINFDFIIEEKENNEVYYKLLKMKLSFILLTHINYKIYLNGIYALDNNIIITKQEKGEEKVILFGNKGLVTKNNNILTKHNNKYYNGRKIVKSCGCFIGYKKYNIYHILSSKSLNESNYKKKSVSSLYGDEHENSSKNNKSFNLNDIASQASSVNSSISRNNLMSYNRGNKQIKKNEHITKDFKVIRISLVIWTILVIIQIVLQYFILTGYYQQFYNKIDFYFLFRDYLIDFNNLFFSILSLSCTAKYTSSSYCINYMHSLTLLLVEGNYPNIHSIIFLELILKQIFIEFDQFLFNQNEILLELLNEKLNKLLEYLSKEKSNIDYFFSKKIHYKISQNMINDKIIISLLKEDITFNDFILLMTSRFRILTKDFNDIKSPIYILNKTGEYTFNNVFLKEKLNSYQENFYLLVLDVKPFSEQADLMNNEITMDMVKIKIKIEKLIFLFLVFNALFIFIFIVILIVYISIYYIIAFKVLRNTHNHLNDKVGELTIKDTMKQKWNNIKIIFKFYDHDINQTIHDLNGIYEEYTNKYNLKLKEEAKIIRKNTKEIKKNKKNENYFKSLKLIKKYNIINHSAKKKIYFYSIIFVVIMSLLLFIIIILFWTYYYKDDTVVSNWIPLVSEVSTETNKLMINFLLMIYNNQTLEEISEPYKPNDYMSYIYTKLANLYESDRYKKHISKIFEMRETEMSYDCTEFYNNLHHVLFLKLLDNFQDKQEKLNNSIYSFCEMTKVMEFKNYKSIYLQFYNLIRVSMENFENSKYSKIIDFIDEYEIYKIEIMYFLTYIYLLDILNENVQNCMIAMGYELEKNISLTGLMFVILLIFFSFIVSCIYIRSVNKDCNNLNNIKKVFRVCNTHE